MKAYLSHHIRGPKGDDSTALDRLLNRAEAMKCALVLRELIPDLQLYVPGEVDDWAEAAYTKGILTVTQILDVDCGIIDTKDVMLMYDWYYSPGEGMVYERDHCLKTGKPFFVFHDLAPRTLKKIKQFLEGVQREQST